MRRASLEIRRNTDSRYKQFARGVQCAGYELVNENPRPRSGDLLIIWNRLPRTERAVRRFVDAGATLIVAENGYIGRDADGGKLIAMSRDMHNGAGRWPEGDALRWASFDVALKPWRQEGDAILVLPQRGIGYPGVAMPHGWASRVAADLRRVTHRRIEVRPHPGDHTEPEFEGYWAAVTWGSGAAIKALAAGLPVFYQMPKWIGARAARYGIAEIEDPWLGDRRPMFERLAWAQWRGSEIETGEPFRELAAL